jgi:transposase
MREMQARIATCGDTRREVWVELNRRGISQKKIAEATGVTEHTVYLELRKNRENST